MFTPMVNSVRLARKSIHNAMQGFTTGTRRIPTICTVGCSQAIVDALSCDSCPIRSYGMISNKTAVIYPTNVCLSSNFNRYSGGKGKNAGNKGNNGADNIDTRKFIHEVEIAMPDVGDKMPGVIVKWYKKKGDLIKPDDVICDIGTELVTFGMVSGDDYDSIMGDILIPEESGSDSNQIIDSTQIMPGEIICKTYHGGKGKGNEATKE